MRREWEEWLKGRRWGELERLAKAEPSQPLTDAVAVVALGEAEKADRKAARKVLWLLDQKGYRPAESSASPEPAAPAKPFEIAFMVSPDGRGDVLITIGMERGDRVRWLTAEVNHRYGIDSAEESDMDRKAAYDHAEDLRQAPTHPFVSAEVPLNFALGKLKEGIAASASLGEGVPPTVAYWRTVIDRAEPISHPAEALPRAELDAEGLRHVAIDQDAALLWRLELGAANPLLEDMRKLNESLPDATLRKPLTDGAIARHRNALFDAATVADHRTRLMDLAYLLHLRGELGARELLAAADDLSTRGGESDYARGLLDKTVVALVDVLSPERVERGAAA